LIESIVHFGGERRHAIVLSMLLRCIYCHYIFTVLQTLPTSGRSVGKFSDYVDALGTLSASYVRPPSLGLKRPECATDASIFR